MEFKAMTFPLQLLPIKNLHKGGNKSFFDKKLRYPYIMAWNRALEQISPCSDSRKPSDNNLPPLYMCLQGVNSLAMSIQLF